MLSVIRSIESRVIMLRWSNQFLRGKLSEADMRQYLQPKGPIWGFGETSLWLAEFQNVTFDSPRMQTIFKLANEAKGIVMIHASNVSQGGRPTELSEVEPSLRKYPDTIFLIHSIGNFDLVAQLMSKYPNIYFSMDFVGSFRLGRGVSLGASAGSKNAESFLAGVNQSGIDYIVARNLKTLAPLLQQYPDRIFWGTDLSEPWHFDESVTDVAIGISRQFIGQLPADIQEKYAYQNARRVFGRFLTPRQ
ncbi:amidohydrolase family protein [Chloroflexota bacterium]